MNSKLFVKAFEDIKKQSQSEKAAKNKITKQSAPIIDNQHPKQHDIKRQNNQKLKNTIQIVKYSDDDEKGQRQSALEKRISKDRKQVGQAFVKKWKQDLYSKLHISKQIKLRTLLIQNSNQKQLVKILKNYKIHIEEISDDKIVFDSVEKANQCLSLLTKSGISAKSADAKDQITPTNGQTKNSKIFDRIQ